MHALSETEFTIFTVVISIVAKHILDANLIRQYNDQFNNCHSEAQPRNLFHCIRCFVLLGMTEIIYDNEKMRIWYDID